MTTRRLTYLRNALSRLRHGTRGFWTPYRYMASVPETIPPYTEIASVLQRAKPSMDDFLNTLNAQDALFAKADTGTPSVDWNSRWISPLDGASIYTAVVMSRPKRIVEVGSGNSTHFMARALLDHDIPCTITCIDPQPRIPIGALKITAEPRVLSVQDSALTDQLQANDILFIDSSHLLQEGFDLDIIMNRMLPRLATGVVVHFHDIFLPYPYPEEWKKRRYNEQNVVAAWLLTGACDVLFASYYIMKDRATDLAKVCPGFPIIAKSGGGSLWLRKTSPAIRD